MVAEAKKLNAIEMISKEARVECEHHRPAPLTLEGLIF
jgi:hypothetical protein